MESVPSKKMIKGFKKVPQFEDILKEELKNANGANDSRPELLKRRLLVRNVRRDVDVATEERVELLANEEANSSQHRDAAMLNLHLAEVADLTR